MTSFTEKLQQNDSDIILMLAPEFDKLPLPITWYDDPFLPFGKAIVSATSDLVAGYLFDLASYMVMASASIIAMERTIAFVPRHKISILHAPFTGTAYSQMADIDAFAVDAITVTRQQDAVFYTDNPPYTAFVDTDHPLPDANTYIKSSQTLVYQPTETVLRIPPADIIYGSKMDDYAEKVREALKQFI